LLQIKQMVQTGNQLRGILTEFGIVMPKGHQRLREAIARLGDDPGYQQLPPSLRAAIDGLSGQLGASPPPPRPTIAAPAVATMASRHPQGQLPLIVVPNLRDPLHLQRVSQRKLLFRL